MKKWTVLLLRPDYLAATFGHDTFCAHVYGKTSAEALAAARNEAIAADHTTSGAEDYYCLLCIRGHHKSYVDGCGGVGRVPQ